ncbi:MAG: hypothetical protein ACI867_002081 [Glaciecola sp.]|jgi:hypothetical protein
MSERVTSRDYANPRRPLGLKVASAALRPVLPRVVPALTPDALLDAAAKAEGRQDREREVIAQRLGKLTDAIEAEAALSVFGTLATSTRLLGMLRSRLRHQALLEVHPEILKIKVARPIVITGLQRTGTTFLHRLLAADPRIRGLRSWEAIAPTPPANGRDTRRNQALVTQRILRYLAPDFFAVHPVEADAPEEDVLLLDQTLLSTVAESTLRVPSFAAWVRTQDQAPAYAMLRELMQSLWWQEPANSHSDPLAAQWVLKTPHHLEFLDDLLNEFPDAIIVNTHRDPLTTVASFASMIAHGRGVMSDTIDPHEVGAEWLAATSRMVACAMETRFRVGNERFIDVHYDDLLADPTGVVAKITERAGLAVSPAAAASVESRRAQSGQHRYGRHVYDLADFGLAHNDVRDAFADYRREFGFQA